MSTDAPGTPCKFPGADLPSAILATPQEEEEETMPVKPKKSTPAKPAGKHPTIFVGNLSWDVDQKALTTALDKMFSK